MFLLKGEAQRDTGVEIHIERREVVRKRGVLTSPVTIRGSHLKTLAACCQVIDLVEDVDGEAEDTPWKLFFFHDQPPDSSHIPWWTNTRITLT